MKKYEIKRIQPRIVELIKSIKHSPCKSLSLGIIILGVGCISLFVFGTLFHSRNFPRTFNIQNSAQSTFVEESEASSDKKMASDQSDVANYAVNPSEGDNVGTISIPALKREINIFQGTGADELSKGVGHFIQSVLPGVKDNCVLSGHNDSVFAKLDGLEIGDLIIIQTAAGEFTYKINETKVVDKDDKTVIVPTDEATLTLTTCYPFVMIGPAPERYIVMARLIND